MEHISKILERSRSKANIPTLRIYEEPEPTEPTEEERREELRQRLNITSWDNTFENFKLVRGTETSVRAFKELASGKASWFMLLCYGTAGCGKTHLCEALSIELAKRNTRCRVNEWAEIIRGFKKDMRSEIKDAYDTHFENFRKQAYLIIDDIGSGSTGSSWEWGELEDIANYRYRENLFTVLTTNLDLKSLPDRVTSRFRDATKSRLILNKANDFRPQRGRNESIKNTR